MSETFATPEQINLAQATALAGTVHQRTQVPLPNIGDSGDTLILAFYAMLHELLVSLSLGANGMCRKTDTLKVVCNPFWYQKSDGTVVHYEAGSTELTLTASATNCVYVDHATGLLATAASWPVDRSTFTPKAIYVCDGSDIVTSDEDADVRGLDLYRAIPNTAAPTGTTATAFTLDDDNVGAGADQQVRFNRGTDDAEDAALEWDEANDRFNVVEQHATGTLCPVNASEVQIAGTAALTSGGAAKVQAAVAGNGLTHTAGVLTPHVDGVTLEVDGSTHELGVIAAGVAAEIVGEGLEVSGDTLVPHVDDSTIEVDSVTHEIQLKAAGITTSYLGSTLAGKLAQVSIGDSTGASPRTVTLQVKDVAGNNLAGVRVVQVGIYQDQYGAAEATDATIAVGATGTLVRSVITDKVLIARTDSAGTLTVTVTDTTSETVFVLAAPAPRSPQADFSDIGTVVIS